jgi:hypothetical protein
MTNVEKSERYDRIIQAATLIAQGRERCPSVLQRPARRGDIRLITHDPNTEHEVQVRLEPFGQFLSDL